MPLDALRASQLRIFMQCSQHADVLTMGGTVRWGAVKKRTVRVQVETATSSFDWKGLHKKNVLPALLPSNTSVDCSAVMANANIKHHFQEWRVPEDGSFVQEPNEQSPKENVTAKTKAYASKRKTGFPKDGTETLYTIEKWLLCFERDTVNTCCVHKLLNETSFANPSTAQLSRAAAQLRNF